MKNAVKCEGCNKNRKRSEMRLHNNSSVCCACFSKRKRADKKHARRQRGESSYVKRDGWWRIKAIEYVLQLRDYGEMQVDRDSPTLRHYMTQYLLLSTEELKKMYKSLYASEESAYPLYTKKELEWEAAVQKKASKRKISYYYRYKPSCEQGMAVPEKEYGI